MQYPGKPHVFVLGGNFAGLTTARFIREQCGKDVDITVIDRKSYLLFIPNIPIEVFANRNPQNTMHMPIEHVLHDDGIDFIQAEVKAIDVETSLVDYVSMERPGSPIEHIKYDYLVVALGARLAYDKIEGFGEYGLLCQILIMATVYVTTCMGMATKGAQSSLDRPDFIRGLKGSPTGCR